MAPYQEELVSGGGLGERRGAGQRTSVTVNGVTDKMQNHRPRQKVIVQTKKVLHKQADRIAKQATEHEHLINKVTYCVGVVCFGIFCYLLGSRPQDIPYVYCAFFLVATPLRWIYYKSKKWHYFLLDFCYYANLIFTVHLLFFPTNQKFFMVCFAFSEGPLAWALIVWRCSLVFSSIDKIVSVLVHLLPGTVQFVIRWWDPSTFAHHLADETGPWPAWPPVDNASTLWVYLFLVPLALYTLWQALYWLVVEVLRKQRMMKDPEVLTSYRELSRKASRANNLWWRLSGVLGDQNRLLMFTLLQALFTVATMALAVPMFRSYRLHAAFQIFKIAMSIWQGGNFFFDVMPRQVHSKNEKKKALKNGLVPGGGDPALPPGKAPTEVDPLMARVALADRATDEKPHGAGGENGRREDEGDRRGELCSVCKQASLNNLVQDKAGAEPPEWLRASKSEADLVLRGRVVEEEEEEEEEEVWEEAEEEGEGNVGEESATGVAAGDSESSTPEALGDEPARAEGGLPAGDVQGSKLGSSGRDFLRRRSCASAVAVGGGYDRVACAS